MDKVVPLRSRRSAYLLASLLSSCLLAVISTPKSVEAQEERFEGVTKVTNKTSREICFLKVGYEAKPGNKSSWKGDHALQRRRGR